MSRGTLHERSMNIKHHMHYVLYQQNVGYQHSELCLVSNLVSTFYPQIVDKKDE